MGNLELFEIGPQLLATPVDQLPEVDARGHSFYWLQFKSLIRKPQRPRTESTACLSNEKL